MIESVHDERIFEAINRKLISVNTGTGEIIRHTAGKQRYLNPYVNPRNLCRISLCMDGKAVSVSVHRVVWIFVHGLPSSPALQINHIDGNRCNNKPDNLEMVTASRNQRHAAEIGLRKVGLRSLTIQQIFEIKMRYKYRSMTDGINALQKDYGVSKTAIWRAIYGCAVTKRFKGKEYRESTGHRRDMRFYHDN